MKSPKIQTWLIQSFLQYFVACPLDYRIAAASNFLLLFLDTLLRLHLVKLFMCS